MRLKTMCTTKDCSFRPPCTVVFLLLVVQLVATQATFGAKFSEKSFIDGLFHDSETLKWTYKIDPNMDLSEDAKSKERNCKGVAKRAKVALLQLL
ncbi:hypothetical protein LOK49_Contig324G00001 [Camellia lanceoleosa]|nr:hypothetical protein LOK49_Contig324G00001 [Camellia lanceoleosa]